MRESVFPAFCARQKSCSCPTFRTQPPLPSLQLPNENTEIATLYDTMRHYFARFRLKICYCSWPPNWPSPSSGERTQGVPLSLFLCKNELTEVFAELTEFSAELSEFSLPKQCSPNTIPPVSYKITKLKKAVTVDFKKTPRTEGWDMVQGSVGPRSAAGLPFAVPEILETKACCDSG